MEGETITLKRFGIGISVLNDLLFSYLIFLELHVWKDVTPQRGLVPIFTSGMSLNLLGDNHILIYGGENCSDLVFYDISYFDLHESFPIISWIEKKEWGSYPTEEEFHLDGDTELVCLYQDKMIFGDEEELYSLNLSIIIRSFCLKLNLKM